MPEGQSPKESPTNNPQLHDAFSEIMSAEKINLPSLDTLFKITGHNEEFHAENLGTPIIADVGDDPEPKLVGYILPVSYGNNDEHLMIINNIVMVTNPADSSKVAHYQAVFGSGEEVGVSIPADGLTPDGQLNEGCINSALRGMRDDGIKVTAMSTELEQIPVIGKKIESALDAIEKKREFRREHPDEADEVEELDNAFNTRAYDPDAEIKDLTRKQVEEIEKAMQISPREQVEIKEKTKEDEIDELYARFNAPAFDPQNPPESKEKDK